MVWNEFKNWVDNQLSDKEKDYPICYIDLMLYQTLKDVELCKDNDEITIQ
jgi:hypothetical protein